MNQTESEKQYLKFSRGEWNKWALTCLAEKNEHIKELGIEKWESSEKKAKWKEKADISFSFKISSNLASSSNGLKEYIFPGETRFGHIDMCISFNDAKFYGNTTFNGTKLEGASFVGTKFHGEVDFSGAKFTSAAKFTNVEFFSETTFSNNGSIAEFEEDVDFSGATFHGHVVFDKVNFKKSADFSSVTFYKGGDFYEVVFGGRTDFSYGTFYSSDRPNDGQHCLKKNLEYSVIFSYSKFIGALHFRETRFLQSVDFYAVTFNNAVIFDGATFAHNVDFRGVSAERIFSLGDVKFFRIPDFQQAHFSEAPYLDNTSFDWDSKRKEKWLDHQGSQSTIKENVDWETCKENVLAKENADSNSQVIRWRALKRMAIQGHDLEREFAFLSKELRALPITCIRWWIGWFYWLFSNYGRSIARPFIWIVIIVFCCLLFYIGESPVSSAIDSKNIPIVALKAIWGSEKNAQESTFGCAYSDDAKTIQSEMQLQAYQKHDGFLYPLGKPLTYDALQPFANVWNFPESNTSWDAVFIESMLNPTISPKTETKEKPYRTISTNAANEALRLSLMNTFFSLGYGKESYVKIFGCLYGMDQEPNTPITPTPVVFLSAIQQILSGLFLFLIGLALRNMLRLK